MTFRKITGSGQFVALRPMWPPAGLIQASRGSLPLLIKSSRSSIGTWVSRDAADHEDRRRRSAKQPLGLQRHLRQEREQLVERMQPVNVEARRKQVEQIFAGVDPAADKILLEGAVDRRRLGDGADEPLRLDVRELGRPIGAETLAVHEDAASVDIRPCGQVIQHARIHALGALARLQRRLPCAGTVDREEADALRQRRCIGLGDGLLAAVEARNRQHQRYRARRIGGQTQIADDLAALEGNAHDLERRIEVFCMQQIRLDRPLVGGQLARRGRRRPLPEIIEPPGAQEIGVRLLRIGRRPRLRHVTVGDRAPGCRPFVAIARLDASERLGGVGRLDAKRRIGPGLRPRQRLGLDLLDGAVRGLRRGDLAGQGKQQDQQRGQGNQTQGAPGRHFASLTLLAPGQCERPDYITSFDIEGLD